MTEFEQAAVEEVLRSELGKTARFSLYGRENRTPMTFVLDEVERQMGRRFSVYWVDGGPPEVFCLPGFSPSPVVFSTRYLSLTAFIRHLLVDAPLKNVLVDVAERTALKVVAEMALRHGDPDFAVLAFAKSVTGEGVWLNDDDQLMALEYEKKNEAYMATWFYGLVHELGHLHPDQTRQIPDNHMFSDAGILDAIRVSLDKFSSYPDSLKQEAIERAKQQRSKSVLGIDQVRSEGQADIFAASILFQTTFDIMREIDEDKFEVLQFVQEMIIFLNIIAIVDRCRRVASIASATTPERNAVFEMGLHAVAVHVRALMQRQYLDAAITRYLVDSDDPKPEDSARIQNVINELTGHFAETVDAVDSGVARAMNFSLFPERRENDWALLEAFRNEVSRSEIGTLEAQRFCQMADDLETDGKLLTALKGIVGDPSKPLSPDPRGDFVYFVPWLVGPNINRPFGLDTKYGHLIFVFRDQGALYDVFFKSSAQALKPGVTLEKAAVAVPREERLGPELAARMPAHQRFGIVVEGTEAFAQYMKELADDTIWDA